MFIHFDTEFTTLDLYLRAISIGLVADDGREFYAELTDADEHKHCSEFARKTVLPLLDSSEAKIDLDQLVIQLGAWLESFNEPVILTCNSLEYDWRWFTRIFTLYDTWPANLDRRPLLLKFPMKIQIEIVEKAFDSGLRRHHALDDAKANRLGWLAFRQLNLQSNPIIQTQCDKYA
jgi:hypothetical protein